MDISAPISTILTDLYMVCVVILLGIIYISSLLFQL